MKQKFNSGNKSDGEKLISNDMFSVSESICS